MDLIGVVVHIVLSSSDEESNLQSEELVGCFGMGIALLSMQIDHLKALGDRSPPNQLQALHTAAVNLWESAVKCQLAHWLAIAQDVAVLQVEHELQQTFLLAVLAAVLEDCRLENINSNLILSATPHPRPRGDAGSQAVTFDDLFPVRVEDLLHSLDVGSIQPESEQRLSTLLKMCIDTALR